MSDKERDTKQDHTIAAKLRKRAVLQTQNMDPIDLTAKTSEEIQKVFHELRVHQIELEMQNEELRTAQIQIDALRARYFDLYDTAPVSYCTLSELGVILEANLTVASLLGVNRSMLVNQSMSRFIFKDDQDIFYLHRKQLLKTGEPQECDLRMVKQNEELIWVHLTESMAQSEDGSLLSRVVINDITERKQAEAERVHLNDQLNQALKMESIGRLAGGIAHDFNNKLQIILGYIEMALDEIGPSNSLYADLVEIQKTAQSSADLTRQLLAFARKQAITPKVLDLNDTVEGMLKMLRRLVGEDINLTLKSDPGLWPVKMDPIQIDQILVNLCVNARAAIAGVGKITVETRNTTLDKEYCAQYEDFVPGEYVQLTVNDNGSGIDDETFLHLFEPYYTTKVRGRGTGLGLATVYGIAKQNNCFINVYSDLGQGSTFNIFLPRHTDKTEIVTKKEPIQAMVRGSETILIVEDESDILKITAHMLQKNGYTVHAANSPSGAIRLVKKYTNQIDLLLTDMIMPEMNGRDLANKILSICPSIKCLFMSGYNADLIDHRGLLDKGAHFIQKPFSLKDLVVKMREVQDG